MMLRITEEIGKWYTEYIDELYAYGMAFGLEKGIVLDAIHDVFLHLYESADMLNVPDNPKFYLLRSLKNKIVELNRKRPELFSLEEDKDLEFQIKTDALSLIEDEEERLRYEKQVDDLLKLLTDKQREVIYLHFMQGISYQDIAEILDVTPKNVRKMIYRALRRMQDEFLFVWIIFV